MANHARFLSTSCVLNKNLRSGRYKMTIKKDRKLTYEEAQGPHQIGVTKTWNSWNTSTLKDEEAKTAEITVEDMFIRRFMAGTWHGLFVSEIVIKRRMNIIVITGLIKEIVVKSKVYFLIGYTEEILSHLLKRPVKVEIRGAHIKDVTFKQI